MDLRIQKIKSDVLFILKPNINSQNLSKDEKSIIFVLIFVKFRRLKVLFSQNLKKNCLRFFKKTNFRRNFWDC